VTSLTPYSSTALTVSHSWKMSGSSSKNLLQGYMYEPKYDENTEETPAIDDMSDSSDI